MAEMIKIKLLKNTPLGNTGDVVEVPKPLADQMCSVRMLHDGHKDVPYRTAKPADEKDISPTYQTASQATLAGKKNIVETPKDDSASPVDENKTKKSKTNA